MNEMLACDMSSMWGLNLVTLSAAFALLALSAWALVSITRRPSNQDAQAILEERFAKGEIDSDEFERRRHALEEAR
jgi:uncharacterized membrane protein